MLLSILHICYGGWEARSKFDMLLIGAKFSKQHSADQNGKNNWKDDSSKNKAPAIEQLNKTEVCYV